MEDVETYTFDPQSVLTQDWAAGDIKQDNIDRLKKELCKEYKGQMFVAETLFNNDQRKRLHSSTHYLMAFRQLYDDGKIDVQYTDGKNHKASVLISPTCYITFK